MTENTHDCHLWPDQLVHACKYVLISVLFLSVHSELQVFICVHIVSIRQALCDTKVHRDDIDEHKFFLELDLCMMNVYCLWEHFVEWCRWWEKWTRETYIPLLLLGEKGGVSTQAHSPFPCSSLTLSCPLALLLVVWLNPGSGGRQRHISHLRRSSDAVVMRTCVVACSSDHVIPVTWHTLDKVPWSDNRVFY